MIVVCLSSISSFIGCTVGPLASAKAPTGWVFIIVASLVWQTFLLHLFQDLVIIYIVIEYIHLYQAMQLFIYIEFGSRHYEFNL